MYTLEKKIHGSLFLESLEEGWGKEAVSEVWAGWRGSLSSPCDRAHPPHPPTLSDPPRAGSTCCFCGFLLVLTHPLTFSSVSNAITTTGCWHGPYLADRINSQEGGWPFLIVLLFKGDVHLSGVFFRFPVMS